MHHNYQQTLHIRYLYLIYIVCILSFPSLALVQSSKQRSSLRLVVFSAPLGQVVTTYFFLFPFLSSRWPGLDQLFSFLGNCPFPNSKYLIRIRILVCSSYDQLCSFRLYVSDFQSVPIHIPQCVSHTSKNIPCKIFRNSLVSSVSGNVIL